jgi:hypothetical protein
MNASVAALTATGAWGKRTTDPPAGHSTRHDVAWIVEPALSTQLDSEYGLVFVRATRSRRPTLVESGEDREGRRGREVTPDDRSSR